MNQLPNDAEIITINGESQNIGDYYGKTLLITNTASLCGFASQLKDLESLYQKYKSQGLMVLAFPCQQFKREKKQNSDIKEFCKQNFNISFPIFNPILVNGKNTHPLFKQLKEQQPGFLGTKSIKWNFTKFLIDSKGYILQRFAPSTSINKIETSIQDLLKQQVD